MKEKSSMRQHADIIIRESLQDVLPDHAVEKVLEKISFRKGRVILVAVGKAAWQMANAAHKLLGERISKGIVITKYEHSKGGIPGIQIREAGHPVPDENSFRATEEALAMVRGLDQEDTVLFLLSGGGSTLFEKPLIGKEELEHITRQLLQCGADIVEMNTIRKRLSGVKGGRFGQACEPAHICNVVLSDIIGDPLDMIASGPTSADRSTCKQALEVVEKYKLSLKAPVIELLKKETPKRLENVETYVTGSVKALCEAARKSCERLGYESVILTTSLNCTARDAGSFLAAIAREWADTEKSLAFIAGGETVVHITGNGKGGRNQELALAAAEGISGLHNVVIFSLGSDGTDGPTDAAGGFVCGETNALLERKGIRINRVLSENDAYHALKVCDGLIMTGATGTNVNDVSVVLIHRKSSRLSGAES